MKSACRVVAASVLAGVSFAVAPVGAQELSRRAVSPWVQGGVGMGSIDVEAGSDDLGLAGEFATGVDSRLGLGGGARVLIWSRPDILSTGGWNATTVIAFASYRLPPVPIFRVTTGIGRSRIHRHSASNADTLTVNETVAETGAELVAGSAAHLAFAVWGRGEWNLGARLSSGPSLEQWYVGLSVRLR